MSLQLERLEARDVPAVTILHAEVAPTPDGDPGFTVKVIHGDPQHSPGRAVEPQGGPWKFIFIGA